jgi:hypothetical protein
MGGKLSILARLPVPSTGIAMLAWAGIFLLNKNSDLSESIQ